MSGSELFEGGIHWKTARNREDPGAVSGILHDLQELTREALVTHIRLCSKNMDVMYIWQLRSEARFCPGCNDRRFE